MANFTLDAYQLTIEGEKLLLFTHRQIGELVGKSKSTVQRFLKDNAADFPEPIKAKIPERPRPIALTQFESAIAYWKKQTTLGNRDALRLLEAINSAPSLDVEPAAEEEAPNPIGKLKEDESLSNIAQSIEIASRWMEEAGVEKQAIAHWRLTQLGKQAPEVADVTASAQSLLASQTTTPTGMIPSQLATQLSVTLRRTVKASVVNQALHELGFQDWAKPGVNRERKLTEAGRQYGTALLTTSSDGWQGAQIRWFDTVLPVLCEHLSTISPSASELQSG